MSFSKYLILLLFALISYSCANSDGISFTNKNYESDYVEEGFEDVEDDEMDEDGDEDGEEDDGEDDEEDSEDIEFEDGVYNASVEYYNPETNYYATYELEVEVFDNQVTVIYFPKGGWLDEDHISPDYLDANGYVEIEGENGKTYVVQLYY